MLPDSSTLAPDGTRLILYHKQATSAMTHFLQFADGGICAFDPLPPLAALVEEGDRVTLPNVKTHPAQLLSRAESWLDMSRGSLELDTDFQAMVDLPGGACPVYLVRFDTTDPPHTEVARVGGRFAVLTEMRNLPPAELLLLGLAYKVIMEG